MYILKNLLELLKVKWEIVLAIALVVKRMANVMMLIKCVILIRKRILLLVKPLVKKDIQDRMMMTKITKAIRFKMMANKTVTK